MMCHIWQTVYLYIIYFPLTELEVELIIFVTDACLVRNCSHFSAVLAIVNLVLTKKTVLVIYY